MVNNHSLHEEAEVCIWGCGLTGYTIAAAFAQADRRCLVTDLDSERIKRVNSGLIALTTVPGITLPQLTSSQRTFLRGTTDWNELLTSEHPVHIVCVPTERDGVIDVRPLEDVVTKIATSQSAARPLYLIIESTISPIWVKTVIHQMFKECYWKRNIDYHIGCSPRRDWFFNDQMTLANTPKVVGSDSPEGLALMRSLYGEICREVLVAPDAQHAAAVKVVENFFRYRNILLANELAAALGDFDIATTLRLAATKWNMDLYHPSFGIGGYCVPLAKDYLAAALDGNNGLHIDGDVQRETELAKNAHEALLRIGEFNRVAVLGLSYMPGVKIHSRSPTLALNRFLRERGRTVKVHDPYYSAEEIREITGTDMFDFPADLKEFDAVVLVSNHEMYAAISDEELAGYLAKGTCLVDNLGSWRDRRFPNWINYVEVGSAGYYHRTVPDKQSSLTDSDGRRYLQRCVAEGSIDAFFAHVDRILAIDRDYLYVEFEGVRMNIPELAERLRLLKSKPIEELTDAEVEAVCSLAALGMAWVRLEHVDMRIDLPYIDEFLRRTTLEYRDALKVEDERFPDDVASRPWWDLASQLPALRNRIDKHHFRLAQIDGETWYRREFLLKKNSIDVSQMHEFTKERLSHDFTLTYDPTQETTEDYFRRLTQSVIGIDGHPLRLIHVLMETAAIDPRIRADHTTLLCPRGTKLEAPWDMDRKDFLAYVIFRPGFTEIPEQGVYAPAMIRKAMHAHHAAKKAKIARRYLAKYGPTSQASLEDNLGGLGIYFNEDRHHKGHAISGVVTAMRFLMPIEIRRKAKNVILVEGLTDFRVTRSSRAEEDRFCVEEFPPFYAYGVWMRTILETTFAQDIVLPPMLSD